MPNPRSPSGAGHTRPQLGRDQSASVAVDARKCHGGDGACFKEACVLRIWSKQRGALNLEKSD